MSGGTDISERPVEDSEIISAMIRNGGGFVSALGQAAARADSMNLQTIKEAFSGYWQAYGEIALMLRVRERQNRGE